MAAYADAHHSVTGKTLPASPGPGEIRGFSESGRVGPHRCGTRSSRLPSVPPPPTTTCRHGDATHWSLPRGIPTLTHAFPRLCGYSRLTRASESSSSGLAWRKNLRNSKRSLRETRRTRACTPKNSSPNPLGSIRFGLIGRIGQFSESATVVPRLSTSPNTTRSSR